MKTFSDALIEWIQADISKRHGVPATVTVSDDYLQIWVTLEGGEPTRFDLEPSDLDAIALWQEHGWQGKLPVDLDPIG